MLTNLKLCLSTTTHRCCVMMQYILYVNISCCNLSSVHIIACGHSLMTHDGPGPDYTRFFNYEHIKYQLLKILKMKRDINQQNFKIVDKSE